MQTKKVQKNWDLTYATFFWRLYWKRGKEFTTSSSKVWGEPEAADKNMVLFRCIEMLLNRGMIQLTHKIEIFKKSGPIIQLNQDPCICTLYADHYEPDLKYLVQYHCDYLRDVYKAITTGQAIPEGSRYKPVRKIKNTPLDHNFRIASNTVYSTYDNFVQTYQYLKSNGLPPGQLDALERSVRMRQPHLFYDDKPAQGHVIVKERRLIPKHEYLKKQDLTAAAERIKQKLDPEILKSGADLKTLLLNELKNAPVNQQKKP